jgi:hypothetical protein
MRPTLKAKGWVRAVRAVRRVNRKYVYAVYSILGKSELRERRDYPWPDIILESLNGIE